MKWTNGQTWDVECMEFKFNVEKRGVEYMLVISAYTNNIDWLYDVDTFYLELNEIKMNDGRFKNFEEYMIDGHKITTGYSASELGDIVDWVHKNVTDKWSLHPSMQHLNDPKQLWVFRDKRDAMLFKLRW